MTDPAARRHSIPPPDTTGLEVIKVLALVYSDPHRLIDVLSTADTDDEAVMTVAESFGLALWQAEIVMDQQLRHLTRGRARARAREIELADRGQ